MSAAPCAADSPGRFPFFAARVMRLATALVHHCAFVVSRCPVAPAAAVVSLSCLSPARREQPANRLSATALLGGLTCGCFAALAYRMHSPSETDDGCCGAWAITCAMLLLSFLQIAHQKYPFSERSITTAALVCLECAAISLSPSRVDEGGPQLATRASAQSQLYRSTEHTIIAAALATAGTIVGVACLLLLLCKVVQPSTNLMPVHSCYGGSSALCLLTVAVNAATASSSLLAFTAQIVALSIEEESGFVLPLWRKCRSRLRKLSAMHLALLCRGLDVWAKLVSSDKHARRLICFIALTLAVMLLELIYGMSVNSLGLVSDSFHMLLDAASLAIGLCAAQIDICAVAKPGATGAVSGGSRCCNDNHSRHKVLGGFLNAVLLIFIAFYILVESAERIIAPPEIHGAYLFHVSLIGLGVNMIGVLFFHDAHLGHMHANGECVAHVDHNMYAVYLHILADLLGSVNVIVSSIIIRKYDWWIVDPLGSALSALLILLSALPLVKETGKVLLLSAPTAASQRRSDVDEAVHERVRELTGVREVERPMLWLEAPLPQGSVSCLIRARIDPNQDYAELCLHVKENVQRCVRELCGCVRCNVYAHLEI